MNILNSKYIEVDEKSEQNIKQYLFDLWKTYNHRGVPAIGNINGVSIVIFSDSLKG